MVSFECKVFCILSEPMVKCMVFLVSQEPGHLGYKEHCRSGVGGYTLTCFDGSIHEVTASQINAVMGGNSLDR